MSRRLPAAAAPAVIVGLGMALVGVGAVPALAQSTPSATTSMTPSATPSASPSASPAYTVQLHALSCPSYSDVRANLPKAGGGAVDAELGATNAAREGVPSYVSGASVSPTTEAADNGPGCTPIPGWQFTIGTGWALNSNGATAGVDGLSIVTGADALPTGITQPAPTGADGVSTLTLTGPVPGNDVLRVQGGTPAQPLGPTPGQYGFAALRCSTDHLNQDNVEYLDLASSGSTTYCYAYYVTPAPGYAAVTVTKQVTGVSGATQPFAFTLGGGGLTLPASFSLAPGGSHTVYVPMTGEAVAPLTLTEAEPSVSWTLSQITCSGPSAAPTIRSELVAAATIAPAALCPPATTSGNPQTVTQTVNAGTPGAYQVTVTNLYTAPYTPPPTPTPTPTVTGPTPVTRPSVSPSGTPSASGAPTPSRTSTAPVVEATSVVASPVASALPTTGASETQTRLLLGLGAGLVLAGAGLAAATRRRGRHT